jgi:trigger factor
MQIERNDIDALNAELSISIAPADYTERVETAIKKYRKNVQIPGFRPGHVPASLIRQRYGKSILAEEINTMLQDKIDHYIRENQIQILGSPMPMAEDQEVGDWDNPGDFRFKYQLGLAPEFDVELNASVSFDYYKLIVDESLVDRQVKDMARRFGSLHTPDVSAADDMLMVKLEELDQNGEPKAGGIVADTTVSIEYIKDEATKNALTGIAKDAQLTVNPHHLSENHEDLAKMLGITHDALHQLDSQFRLTVTDVKRMVPHAYDQELFDKIFGAGEVTSEEEMRERVKADLEKMFSRDSDYVFKREMAAKLRDMINPQLPDEFLKRFIRLTNEKPITDDVLEREYPLYADQLRWDLIESRILGKYNIQVSYDELKSHVKADYAARFAQYGLPVDDERLEEMAKEVLSKKDELRNIYGFLQEEKIAALVKENCTINTISLAYDAFVNKVQHG